MTALQPRWSRPAASEPWCLVDSMLGGSVRTACNGRWSDKDAEYCDVPHVSERCGGCQSAAEAVLP